MSDPALENRQATKHVRRQSTPTPHDLSITHALPADILETGVRRLGFLGLVIALTAPASYLLELFTQPARVAAEGTLPLSQLVALMLFFAGGAVCALAWTRTFTPAFMLDLGLIFYVVVAFAIALSENATPWPPDLPIRGISWNCLWISVYVIAVPGTVGKTNLAAIAAACMAPFGMLVATEANRIPMPQPWQAAVLLVPPFAAAAWSIPAARYLHRLSAQVKRAQAMGSYELLELLGRGGMGEVWRARHRMLARDSAIKLIRPEVLSGGNMDERDLVLRRFEREARATAALQSPHTVSLYDYGATEEGSFYYVMELLDGLDLETMVREFGPLPPERVVSFLVQAAKSLAEAHAAGLVHRDIKPRNIFACRLGTEYDFIKILDFGLVKVAAGEGRTVLTRENVAAGTPAYIAPEVAMGESLVDGRADIYSLACVAYWLLTGQLVFDGPNAMAVALAHVQREPVPPSQRTELAIPACLEEIIMRCLSKDPEKRPANARELARQLMSCKELTPWTAADAERWWTVHYPRKAETLALTRD